MPTKMHIVLSQGTISERRRAQPQNYDYATRLG
jgi:hypothetical protein